MPLAGRRDGGPTAIRTRVTSSASSCDIQATLWVQRVFDPRLLYNPDGFGDSHGDWEHGLPSWFGQLLGVGASPHVLRLVSQDSVHPLD